MQLNFSYGHNNSVNSFTLQYEIDPLSTVMKTCCMHAEFVVSVCDDDWLEFNGQCYYVSNDDDHSPREDTTWRKSRDRCLASGGELATILTAEERRWLTNIVKTCFISRHICCFQFCG